MSFWPAWGLLWMLALGFQALRGVRGVPLGAAQLLLVCAVAAGVVALVIRRLAAPVADIVSAAERIGQRDYRVRVTVPSSGPAWIGDTARAFNAMATELEAQDTARRQLMADIAHELRTPLAIVQGTLEGLIDGVYPRDDERLQGLLDDTRVLARLVDDLRTLATAEGGALALAKEPTDLVALANDVVASLDGQAQEAGITLRVDAPAGEIDPVTIDPVRIREVLTNLVANALRYTPRAGQIRIAIDSSSAAVDVRVSDTGSGIAPADLPHVFDRFYKGTGSSGSGLGLTIARRLVEAHGGSIRAESVPGQGTTIAFRLPRDAA
ncbi:MAG TPA: HAMP domain-containing sensor histidine kinase [Vicinamibacterales bacterium]|nr:HAMP domain-containing sensor histidine kinase [Vicinamibacterales bacterium]